MENVNKDLGKTIDVSELYIGIYDSKEGDRIGLFKKDKIHTSWDGKNSDQFYKDILSDYYVAMRLDSQGKDRKAQYHVLTGDPAEKANWRGIIGTVNITDLPRVLPSYSNLGEIYREYGLIELSSAIPNLKANSSLAEIIEALINFYSRINLKEEVVKQITENLQLIPKYFESKNEKLPTFLNSNALNFNEIDMSNIPEGFNTIKHR